MSVEDFPLRLEGRETPERILKAATNWKDLEDVVVIGVSKTGEHFVSSTSDMVYGTIGLLEWTKHILLEEAYD